MSDFHAVLAMLFQALVSSLAIFPFDSKRCQGVFDLYCRLRCRRDGGYLELPYRERLGFDASRGNACDDPAKRGRYQAVPTAFPPTYSSTNSFSHLSTRSLTRILEHPEATTSS